MWIECADLVALARGVVVLLTHCERRFSGRAEMLDAYRRLLEHLSAGTNRFTFSRPAAVIDGVRERELLRASDATRATAS